MIRIAALNESSASSDEEDLIPTREVLEVEAANSYKEALSLLAKGENENAEKVLKELLKSPYLEKVTWTRDADAVIVSLPHDVAMKYSCLKNLANLMAKKGDYENVVSYLNEGLTINPNHWPCIDQLLSVLFILYMYLDCLGLAMKALNRDPNYVKALSFTEKIFEEQPSMKKEVRHFFQNCDILFAAEKKYDKKLGNDYVRRCEKLRPPNKVFNSPLKLSPYSVVNSDIKLTWLDLGGCLLETYTKLLDEEAMTFIAQIDVQSIIENIQTKNSQTVSVLSKSPEESKNDTERLCNENQDKNEHADAVSEKTLKSLEKETLTQSEKINTSKNTDDFKEQMDVKQNEIIEQENCTSKLNYENILECNVSEKEETHINSINEELYEKMYLKNELEIEETEMDVGIAKYLSVEVTEDEGKTIQSMKEYCSADSLDVNDGISNEDSSLDQCSAPNVNFDIKPSEISGYSVDYEHENELDCTVGDQFEEQNNADITVSNDFSDHEIFLGTESNDEVEKSVNCFGDKNHKLIVPEKDILLTTNDAKFLEENASLDNVCIKKIVENFEDKLKITREASLTDNHEDSKTCEFKMKSNDIVDDETLDDKNFDNNHDSVLEKVLKYGNNKDVVPINVNIKNKSKQVTDNVNNIANNVKENMKPLLDTFVDDTSIIDSETKENNGIETLDNKINTVDEEAIKKKKRTKRGLERELEQLDYWGRKREREMKRRRKTLTMKLLGISEDSDTLTWAELLQSFIPASLLKFDNSIQSSGSFCQSKKNINTCSVADTGSGITVNSENMESQEVGTDNFTNDKMNDIIFSIGTKDTELQSIIFSKYALEEEQVQAFLKYHIENGGIYHLLLQFLKVIIRRYGYMWPRTLAKLHIEIYSKLSDHMVFGAALSSSEDRDKLYQESMMALINWELVVSLLSLPGKEYAMETDFAMNLLKSELVEDHIFYLKLIVGRNDVWREKSQEFHTRFGWLMCQIYLIKGDIDESIFNLQQLLNDIDLIVKPEENYSILCAKVENDDRLINSTEIKKQLAYLQRSQLLEDVVGKYKNQEYDSVADILMTIFHCSYPNIKQGVALPSRQEQILILVDSLHKLQLYKEMFEWGSKGIIEALEKYNKSECDIEKYSWSNTFIKVLETLDQVIRLDHSIIKTLENLTLVELVRSLMQILVIQMEPHQTTITLPYQTLAPWFLLHRFLYEHERRQPNKTEESIVSTNDKCESSQKEDNDCGDDDSLPKELPFLSSLFLITAHEELGKRSWCMFGEGNFLLYSINIYIEELKKNLDEHHQQAFHCALEQATFCLYSHPPKKFKHKHLRDHGVPQVRLTLDKAIQLYNYYRPPDLPNFQSSQIPSIADDVATLVKRIIALLPEESKPESQLSDVVKYITGTSDTCDYQPFKNMPNAIIDAYYLLGDYSFKSKEWSSAIKYYELDVSINIGRIDSWAPLALSKKAQLENVLISCEGISNPEIFFQHAQEGVQCFKWAVHLDEQNSSLWTEFGVLVYVIHSTSSRFLKQDLNSDINIEMFEKLEEIKQKMLSQAETCFKSNALRLYEVDPDEDTDERWLYEYMLGKIGEKFGRIPQEILSHYIKSAQYLHELGAKYPQKINYNSPPLYSVEALEIYYRVHAYILKYMEHNEGKCIEDRFIQYFKEILTHFDDSPFVRHLEAKKSDKHLEESMENAAADCKASNVQQEGKVCDSKQYINILINDIIDTVVDKSKPQNFLIKSSSSIDEVIIVGEHNKQYQSIIYQCLESMQVCLVRFPEHYKSLYRLAHYYQCSKLHKDVSRARNYLLGCEFWQRLSYMPVNGLFHERKLWIQNPKHSNFFHGIWKIPNDEIDRPGSFAAHMYRSVSLSLDSLSQLKEFLTILEIALALKNYPDKDKKYLRDNERELLSEHATQVGLQTLKEKHKQIIKSPSSSSFNYQRQFLSEVYRIYKQMMKYLPQLDPHVTKLLIEVYAAVRNIDPQKYPDILREVESYCMRNAHLISHRNAIGSSSHNNVARRGRPPLGSCRGRGSYVKNSNVLSNEIYENTAAVQQAYKIYENIGRCQNVLRNKNIDSTTQQKYKKQVEELQKSLLKYMQIPSVGKFFSNLPHMNIATKPKLNQGLSAHLSAKPKTTQMFSTLKSSEICALPKSTTIYPSSEKPNISELASRSQIHGVSITTVSSRMVSEANNVAKSNTLVTASNTKAPVSIGQKIFKSPAVNITTSSGQQLTVSKALPKLPSGTTLSRQNSDISLIPKPAHSINSVSQTLKKFGTDIKSSKNFPYLFPKSVSVNFISSKNESSNAEKPKPAASFQDAYLASVCQNKNMASVQMSSKTDVGKESFTKFKNLPKLEKMPSFPPKIKQKLTESVHRLPISTSAVSFSKITTSAKVSSSISDGTQSSSAQKSKENDNDIIILD